MILEIPSGDEYERSSVSLLNLSWNTAATLTRNLEAVNLREWDDDARTQAQYWERVQVDLGNAYTLVEQAQEFGLKGLIAEVSPYLLIRADVRDWPRQCDRRNVDFSEFYTVDANDLIKLHDTVAPSRLDPAFVRLFNEVRRKRNAIVHGVRKSAELRPKDIFKHVLETFHFLHPSKSWFHQRLSYHCDDPLSLAYSEDLSRDLIIEEFSWLTKLLGRKECRDHLNFNKGQRAYLCPECSSETSEKRNLAYTAQLQPNDPESTLVRCSICLEEKKVIRQRCPSPACKGNVIAGDYYTNEPAQCLSCGNEIPGDWQLLKKLR